MQRRALIACSLLAAPALRAQPAFPQRAVRIVVGYPPGQTVDVTARAYAAALQQAWGQPVVVDNRSGANGIIGAEAVKTAEADGHTLLFGTSGQMTINPAIYRRLPYDTMRDFAPVALGAASRLYLVANKALPVTNLPELVAYAKARPGRVSFGSGGTGITAHLAMEMLAARTGMELLHIPYRGSPAALTALLSGEVQLMIDAGTLLTPQIRDGHVRPLAVSSLERFAGMPEVPTVAEQGFPGFQVVTWSALFAPAATPPAVVEAINAQMQAAGRLEMVLNTVRAGGSEPRPLSTEQFADFVRSELAQWGEAARAANVTAD
ncbi:tripartite tricarboxylate transporter substrate binding protein [Rhodovarius crocodyli]|uniref:Tripartite tricarboxylate transporter substrate binding protein n=1 Tax=Rhodovarius crocodyli TaxID=1979269 RepID=A0A437M259_9PROT|nr:tripartite tricarboxylate transporter substrate binding protein [Rhodovarius crocodyli]RVT91778.1 tripartite tricarboxylate transporter substrate binding protein [Rhodovarius crocodyli]